MQLNFDSDKSRKWLTLISVRRNFSSLNKKKEDSFQVWVEVKWESVSPRVNKQMKGSEQLKFIAERWVFRPRLVTWPRHVTEQVALQPIGKTS